MLLVGLGFESAQRRAFLKELLVDGVQVLRVSPVVASHALPFWPWNSTVRTDLDIYTGFTPPQLMTNTSDCCYSL